MTRTWHHPPFDLIAEFAIGSLAEPVALSVACHVEMCRKCASRVRELEAVGGAMLDAIEPAAISDRELAAVMERIEEADPEAAALPSEDVIGSHSMPRALARYLGLGLESLSWRNVGRFFDEARLPIAGGTFKASILRLKPGSSMPRHTHRGVEYTLVLAGGYTDDGRQYLPGDFSAKDSSNEHNPIVDDDGECICLVVMDAPVHLTGSMGLLLNPFLRF